VTVVNRLAVSDPESQVYVSNTHGSPLAVQVLTRHTTHDTRHTTHDTRHTTHDTRHTTHDTRHTTHDTAQLVPGLLSLMLELCKQDPTRLLSTDDTIEASLRTVISVCLLFVSLYPVRRSSNSFLAWRYRRTPR
jgi:hypothetical protein